MLKRNKKRNVLFVTGSRGEYGYIRPIIKLMKHSDSLYSKILATNMHLLPEFGNSLQEFAHDDIPIEHKAFMALSGHTNTTMVKSLGVFMLSIADVLENSPPDIILLAGDRGEQLIAGMAGAHMNIPVAHIQAGELSGNVDGMSRHAITRFAHMHFASNEDAARRLVNMGEEEFRVFNVGAPQLDEIVANNIAPPAEVAKMFSVDVSKPLALVAQHPVTEQALLSGQQMRETISALIEMELQGIIIYPNNDAGSRAIMECIQSNRKIKIKVERNVSRKIYLGLMNVASVIIGNSSSGILEAPSFKLPAVNIGRRQQGRYQGENVINVEEHEKELIKAAIQKALSQDFKKKLEGTNNPYGDGKSSERIVNVLETIPINEKLLYKNLTY